MTHTRRRRRRKKHSRQWLFRRRRNILLAILLCAGLVWGFYTLLHQGMLPANETADQWSEVSKNDIVLVNLPADDAPHDNYTEWWYYSGHLQGTDGREYSFHYTLFLLNAMTVHTVIHASFVDHRSGERYSYQSRTGGNPGLDVKGRFDFTLGDWVMKGENGNDVIRGKTPDFGFKLGLSSAQPPVFQGGSGLLDFKDAGKSYYYSRSRMAVQGYAGLHGQQQWVAGQAWFDHQWGDFRTTIFGWEWFALQLDDGVDIMLYQLYDQQHQPILISGTYTKEGATSVLLPEDIITTASGYWTSPLSKINYPVEWSVEIPSKKIKLMVKARHQASEFDGRKSTYNLYWEGAVAISGSHTGKGFLEVNSADQLVKKPTVEQ